MTAAVRAASTLADHLEQKMVNRQWMSASEGIEAVHSLRAAVAAYEEEHKARMVLTDAVVNLVDKRAPLTDEAVTAATDAWFERVLAGAPAGLREQMHLHYQDRMRRALEAARRTP